MIIINITTTTIVSIIYIIARLPITITRDRNGTADPTGSQGSPKERIHVRSLLGWLRLGWLKTV